MMMMIMMIKGTKYRILNLDWSNNSIPTDTFETRVTQESSDHRNRKRLACLVRSPGKPFKTKDIVWTKDDRNIFDHGDKYDTDDSNLIINVSLVFPAILLIKLLYLLTVLIWYLHSMTLILTVKPLIQDAPIPPSINASHFGLQLSLRNILKPSVKWRMKM